MNPDRQRIGPSVLTTGSTLKTDWLPISAAEAGKKIILVGGSVVVCLGEKPYYLQCGRETICSLTLIQEPGRDRPCRLFLCRKPASSTVVLD